MPTDSSAIHIRKKKLNYVTNLTNKFDIWWGSIEGFRENIEVKWLYYIPGNTRYTRRFRGLHYATTKAFPPLVKTTYFECTQSYLKAQRPNWNSKKSMECWKREIKHLSKQCCIFYVSNSILNQVGFLITKFDFGRILPIRTDYRLCIRSIINLYTSLNVLPI